jgi:hypothetical protein
MISDPKVVVCKEIGPTNLMTLQDFGRHEVFKVFVVRQDFNWNL